MRNQVGLGDLVALVVSVPYQASWAVCLYVVAGCASISVRDFDFEPRLSDYSRPPCVVAEPEWPAAESAIRKTLEATLGPITFHTPHTTDTSEALRGMRVDEDERLPALITFIGRHNGYVIVQRGTTTSMFCVDVVEMVGGPVLEPRLFATMTP